MLNLGKINPGQTIYIPWATFAGATGASITSTGLAVTDVEVYKDGSMTQRASDAGYTLLDTDGIDLDGITGIQGISINLADNTTAGFWAAGSRYWVVISSVTIDSQTVNFIAATFTIGYEGSVLDTTIATLSSQTSFTLTSGPAEDDALNGQWVIIHDVASAVQLGKAVILDYTGSTKTVTLAAGTTFTAAASDNISVMGPMPLQPTVQARTIGVETSGKVNVLLADTATNLTNAPGAGDLTATMKTSVQTAANDALIAQNLDHLVKDAVPTNFQSAVHDDSVVGHLASISDANAFARTTDSLQGQRENFDTVVAAEPTLPEIVTAVQEGLVMAKGTIGSTGNDTTHLHLDGLTYGNDEINNMLLVIKDVSTSEYHSVWITDWVLATELATVATLPFTPENAVDTYWILPVRQDVTGGSGLDAAGVRAAVGLASANLDTQIGDLPTNAELATSQGAADDATLAAIATAQTAIDAIPTNAELATALGTSDDAVLAAIAALNNLASGAAMTLTSGERAAIAAALLDLADGIEVGLTLRQAQRLQSAAMAGKISGAGTSTIVIRNAIADSKPRLTATVDVDGNRTAITEDVS